MNLPMTTAGRAGLWVSLGIVAVSLVVFIDVNRLLGDIESEGRRAYDAGVFTGFKLFFWDTSQLADAVRLWGETQKSFHVRGLLAWHLLTDALAFLPAFCVLLGVVLRRVGATLGFSICMAALLFIVDSAETWTTYYVLVHRNLLFHGNWLTVIQTLSFLKWVVLTAAIVTAIALWRIPRQGTASASDVFEAIRDARRGKEERPAIALLGLIVLVGLFAALIALPAGGPLEQLPDVLRYQLSAEANWRLRVLSILAVLLLAVAVAAAGLMSTDPAYEFARQGTLSSKRVLVGAVCLSVALSVVASCLDRDLRLVPLSFLLVVAGVFTAAWLAQKAGVSGAASAPRLDGPPSPATNHMERRLLWVGALAGVVIVAGGLGLIRAAFPPFILGAENEGGAVRWSTATTWGVLVALLGGLLAQEAVSRRKWSAENGLKVAAIAGGLVVPPAAWLSIVPSHGFFWGTLGVLAIGFAFLALVVGLFKWLSRRHPPWEATLALGFGRRTPWLALLVVTWCLASILNTEGVYHDARVGTDHGPSDPRYANLHGAFEAWLKAQDECPPGARDPTPMVLIAAPGGGIRSAYWTAATLDRLFGPQMGECAERRLFVVSGVSGGSVGATTWVNAMAAGLRGQDAVAAMSKDRALAAAAAGLLLRDLFQPFTGITSSWRDRAALLEDGWIEAAGVYGSADKPLKWSDVGGGLPWVPLLVLNASSVSDGCRVLLANVGDLPAATGRDCGAATGRYRLSGPVSGSIDPFPGLYRRKDTGEPNGTKTGMPAVTAALLSARFPIITPSGALLRRTLGSSDTGDNDARTTTYAVDGGYNENSGLFTLLQIWAEVEPLVRQHNQSLAGKKRLIAPWIVVADNHYRSKAEGAPSQRPLELIAPVSALSNNTILSQSSLEQMAALAIRSPASRCTTSEAVDGLRTDADCTAEPVGASPKSEISSGLVVIAPSKKPAAAAPLGWVLSETSRTSLSEQLDTLFQSPDPAPTSTLSELLRQLGVEPG